MYLLFKILLSIRQYVLALLGVSAMIVLENSHHRELSRNEKVFFLPSFSFAFSILDLKKKQNKTLFCHHSLFLRGPREHASMV